MSIRLQERDKYLLGLLADDFLLLTREQIQQLIPMGLRRANQRLALLTKDKLLARREPVDRISPNTIFYFLGERAADVLDVESIRERRARAKNFGDSYLRHLHLTNSVHIKFLINKEKDYEFRSWTPYDNTKWDGVKGFKLRPDGFVTFVKYGRQYSYFVEIDLGTERGNSIRQKIEQYHRFDYADGFWEEFKRDWFRVLFITTEASRSAALLKIFPSNIFWTVTASEILSRPLFEPCWISKGAKSLALNLGPDPEQAERAQRRKAALLAASAPKPQVSVRPLSSSEKQAASAPIPKEMPKKQLSARFWLKLAMGIGIVCAAVLCGILVYRAVSRIPAEFAASSQPQVFDAAQSTLDPTWTLVLIAAALIVAKFVINAII